MCSFLIHYTSFKNCINILNSKQIYFGNILYSNDYYEKMNVEDEVDDSFFVFCTSYKEFDALMWLAYAKGQDGCAIKFHFKKDMNPLNLFRSSDHKIEFKKIDYTQTYFEDIGDDLELLGRIKDSKFESESEYRYIIHEDNNSFYKYEKFLKVDLEFSCLQKIELVISPALNVVANLLKDKLQEQLPVELEITIEDCLNL